MTQEEEFKALTEVEHKFAILKQHHAESSKALLEIEEKLITVRKKVLE